MMLIMLLPLAHLFFNPLNLNFIQFLNIIFQPLILGVHGNMVSQKPPETNALTLLIQVVLEAEVGVLKLA